MAARDIPITALSVRFPVGRITITDENFERLASKEMQFIISPVVVAKHGTDDQQVIEFTIRALGSEPSVHRAAVIAPNHPVNREDAESHSISESKSSFPEEGRKLMADNKVVKEF